MYGNAAEGAYTMISQSFPPDAIMFIESEIRSAESEDCEKVSLTMLKVIQETAVLCPRRVAFNSLVK